MEHGILADKHGHTDRQRGQFRKGDRQPDAVDVQDGGQDQHGGDLEHQSAQEGDQRTGHAIAQRREEGGRIHVEAHDEEAQRVQPEGAGGQLQQLRVIAHEDPGDERNDEHGSQGHGHGHHRDEPQALLVKVVHLGMVACAVVEADNGGAAHGVAHIHGHEQEGGIHDDAVSGHAVFAGQPQQLVIVQDVYQRHGQVGHQLGGTVDAGIPQDSAVELRFTQVQAAGIVVVEKVEHRQNTAHQLADEGGNGRALDAPAPQAHHHHVQHHIGAARTHGEPEAQVRLFGGDEEALEHILQREGGQRHHQDAAIAHRVVQQFALGTQQHRNGPQEHDAQHGQHADRYQRCQQKHGEITVSLFLVALAQRDAHDGAAAGAQHKADGAQQHGQRHDEVDRCKGRLAHKVGHAQAVHDTVDGGEQHGADAGQHEPQKAGIGKVVGKLDLIFCHESSFQFGVQRIRSEP